MRWKLHIWHVYFTNDALSNGIKVNYFGTFIVTFMLEFAFFDFIGPQGNMQPILLSASIGS